MVLEKSIPALLASLLSLASVASASASETRGPFGPETSVGEETNAFEQYCAPDIHGVTVRLIAQYADYETDESEYRGLVARTDENGNPIEPPFPFASDPSTSYPLAVACDGNGGFVVLWGVFDEPCLRVRAFDRFGAPLAAERTLTPGCTSGEERPVQFDHSAKGHYRTVYSSHRWDDELPGDRILYQSLDASGASEGPVLLRRLAAAGLWDRYDRRARVDDAAGLVVWLRNRVVLGQVIDLDGRKLTEVFRINLPPNLASELTGIEDRGDGTMLARWRSYWQAGDIGRAVAVSTDRPAATTTTTTTLPDDPEIPWFDPAEPLQRIRTREGSQWAWPPTVAASPEGTAIAVWTRTDMDRTFAVSYALRDPTSHAWTSRREFPQLRSAQRSWGPRVINDGNDRWAAMWLQEKGTNCALVMTRSNDDGRSWSPTVAVVEQAFLGRDEAACEIVDFNLAADPNGAWIAVWGDRSRPGADSAPLLRMSRSLDRGESWSEPSTALILENDPWGNVSITPGGGGSWGVAWSTNHHVFYSDHVDTGGDVLFSRSSDGGATWGAPVKVAGEEPGMGIPEHNGVDVATDGVGTWVIAWASDDTLDGRVGDWDIVVSRSTNAGSTWSAPSHVADYAIQDVHDDRFPSVASDGVGGWLLAWATSYSVPGAAGLDYDIAVSASYDGGVSWSGPVTLDDSADSDRRIDGAVDLACSAPGICVAAWTSQSDIPGRRGIAVKGASRIDD